MSEPRPQRSRRSGTTRPTAAACRPRRSTPSSAAPTATWLCRLGVLKEDGWPFVTPMWYQWRGGSFYVVGRKRSAWVQDLIRDPRCFVCIDEEATPPDGGLRKVLARCTADGRRGAGRRRGLAVGSRSPHEMARPLRGRGRAGGPEALVRLGALPRPARPGAGRHDDVAGRRLGEAVPRPEAAGGARGADGRHGVGVVVSEAVEAPSLAELCERFRRLYLSAVCDALFHLGMEEKVLPSVAAAALSPSRGSSARRSPSRATTSRASAGTRASCACGRTSRSSSG